MQPYFLRLPACPFWYGSWAKLSGNGSTIRKTIVSRIVKMAEKDDKCHRREENKPEYTCQPFLYAFLYEYAVFLNEYANKYTVFCLLDVYMILTEYVIRISYARA